MVVDTFISTNHTHCTGCTVCCGITTPDGEAHITGTVLMGAMPGQVSQLAHVTYSWKLINETNDPAVANRLPWAVAKMLHVKRGSIKWPPVARWSYTPHYAAALTGPVPWRCSHHSSRLGSLSCRRVPRHPEATARGYHRDKVCCCHVPIETTLLVCQVCSHIICRLVVMPSTVELSIKSTV